MIRHLTSDEISNVLIGDATPEQQEHAGACTDCTASLQHLKEAFSVFRESVHQWSGKNEGSAPKFIDFYENAPRIGVLRLRWAALTSIVLIILLVIPVLRNKRDKKRARQAIEDALLLEQVNASLSREVPASMEPLMNLVSEGNRQ